MAVQNCGALCAEQGAAGDQMFCNVQCGSGLGAARVTSASIQDRRWRAPLPLAMHPSVHLGCGKQRATRLSTSSRRKGGSWSSTAYVTCRWPGKHAIEERSRAHYSSIQPSKLH